MASVTFNHPLRRQSIENGHALKAWPFMVETVNLNNGDICGGGAFLTFFDFKADAVALFE